VLTPMKGNITSAYFEYRLMASGPLVNLANNEINPEARSLRLYAMRPP
jgi:hypothetical protein